MSDVELNLTANEERLVGELVFRGFFASKEELFRIAVRRLLSESSAQVRSADEELAILNLSVPSAMPKATQDQRKWAVKRRADSGL